MENERKGIVIKNKIEEKNSSIFISINPNLLTNLILIMTSLPNLHLDFPIHG